MSAFLNTYNPPIFTRSSIYLIATKSYSLVLKFEDILYWTLALFNAKKPFVTYNAKNIGSSGFLLLMFNAEQRAA